MSICVDAGFLKGNLHTWSVQKVTTDSIAAVEMFYAFRSHHDDRVRVALEERNMHCVRTVVKRRRRSVPYLQLCLLRSEGE